MGTELLEFKAVTAVAVFTENGLDSILRRVEAEVTSVVTDISTPAGRKEIASLAYKVAQTKTHLDDLGKDLVAEQKKKTACVDAERKRARDFLDELKERVRKPLTDWEDAEKKRIDENEAAISEIFSAATYSEETAPEIEARILRVNAVYQRDWREFAERARLVMDVSVKKLHEKLATRMKHDAEQIELIRLREQEAERKQRERDAAIAAEAASKAKAEAEAKAATELQRAKDAEEKAKRDAAEAVDRERARVEAAQRKEREEAEARAADTKLREKKIDESAEALVRETGLHSVDVYEVVRLIVAGKIPHITMNF